MKLEIDEDSNNPDIVRAEIRNRIFLPQGLFGFADLRNLDLVYDEEELPSCGYGRKRMALLLSF